MRLHNRAASDRFRLIKKIAPRIYTTVSTRLLIESRILRCTQALVNALASYRGEVGIADRLSTADRQLARGGSRNASSNVALSQVPKLRRRALQAVHGLHPLAGRSSCERCARISLPEMRV